MKIVILLLASTIMWSAGSRADQPAIHGMLLFGNEKTYASHLPMFHAPHDYQVLLEVSLHDVGGSTTVETYNEAKKNSSGIFTLVPERMDLTKIISGAKTDLSASIFNGHFEQGGQNLGPVQVKVEKIIFSSKLDSSSPTSNENNFLVFGHSGEYFAAHLIQGKPNYDAVMSVTQPYKLDTPNCFHRRYCPDPTPIAIPDSQLPLTLTTQDTGGTLPKVSESIGELDGVLTDIQKINYLEQGDLAN